MLHRSLKARQVTREGSGCPPMVPSEQPSRPSPPPCLFAPALCACTPPETDFPSGCVVALAGRIPHGGWAGGVWYVPRGPLNDLHPLHYHPPAPLHATSCVRSVLSGGLRFHRQICLVWPIGAPPVPITHPLHPPHTLVTLGIIVVVMRECEFAMILLSCS